MSVTNNHFQEFAYGLSIGTDYITEVEDRPTMSVNIVSHFQSSTFGKNYNAPCSAVSAIAEHLV